MLRQISEDVRVNLKDRLRDIRQGVRQQRRDGAQSALAKSRRQPFPIGEIEGFLGQAAAVFDDAMSLAETLVPQHGKRLSGAAPQGFAAYFPTGGAENRLGSERAFRRDLYYLAQAVLTKRRIEAAVVHEADLAAVHAEMGSRHAGRLHAFARAATPDEQVATTAEICAALLVALLDHHPIRFAAPGSETSAASNGRAVEIGCFAPVVLACGLASLGVDDMSGSDLLEIAMLAADVREDRIVEACGAPDAAGELASIFAVLLAHLP